MHNWAIFPHFMSLPNVVSFRPSCSHFYNIAKDYFEFLIIPPSPPKNEDYRPVLSCYDNVVFKIKPSGMLAITLPTELYPHSYYIWNYVLDKLQVRFPDINTSTLSVFLKVYTVDRASVELLQACWWNFLGNNYLHHNTYWNINKNHERNQLSSVYKIIFMKNTH